MKTHIGPTAGHKVIDYKPMQHVLVPHGDYHVGEELHLEHAGHHLHGHVVHVERHDELHDRLLISVEAPVSGELVH